MTASVPQMEPNLLQRAYENYSTMEEQLAEARQKIVELSIDNGSLVAEVSMLREELARADADRIRLQAVSSTLSGELLSINDVIAGAVRRALDAGTKVAKTATAAPEKPAHEDAVAELAQLAEEPKAIPAPSQGNGEAFPPKVDWKTTARN